MRYNSTHLMDWIGDQDIKDLNKCIVLSNTPLIASF